MNPHDKDLKNLLDQFVCVRVVQLAGVSEKVFQFDQNLTWAAFMMNADKTIYGRYGSQLKYIGFKQANPPVYFTVSGFKKALTGALELHKGQGPFGNKKALQKALKGKTGPDPLWKTPEEIPWIRNFRGKGLGKFSPQRLFAQRCVQCHHSWNGKIFSLRAAKKPIPDRLIWAYPMPNLLGLNLDPDERATVQSVTPNSQAEKGGFKKGDEILTLGGQPMLSIADVQWVLHWAEDGSKVSAKLLRGGKETKATLMLTKDWRKNRGFLGRVSPFAMRRDLVAFTRVALSPGQRTKLGIAKGKMPLQTGYVRPAPPAGPAFAKSGLRRGDVIVALNGLDHLTTPDDFILYLIRETRPGQTVEFKVLRQGKPTTFSFTLPKTGF